MWEIVPSLREVRLTSDNFLPSLRPKSMYQDDMNTSQALCPLREKLPMKASTNLIRLSHSILMWVIDTNQKTLHLWENHVTNKLNHYNVGICGPQDRHSRGLSHRTASESTSQMLSRQRTSPLYCIEKPMGMICFLSSSNPI